METIILAETKVGSWWPGNDFLGNVIHGYRLGLSFFSASRLLLLFPLPSTNDRRLLRADGPLGTLDASEPVRTTVLSKVFPGLPALLFSLCFAVTNYRKVEPYSRLEGAKPLSKKNAPDNQGHCPTFFLSPYARARELVMFNRFSLYRSVCSVIPRNPAAFDWLNPNFDKERSIIPFSMASRDLSRMKSWPVAILLIIFTTSVFSSTNSGGSINRPPLEKSTDLSTTAFNSLIFSLQLWRTSTSIALISITNSPIPISLQSSAAKCFTRSGISSGRSRSAGISIRSKSESLLKRSSRSFLLSTRDLGSSFTVTISRMSTGSAREPPMRLAVRSFMKARIFI